MRAFLIDDLFRFYFYFATWFYSHVTSFARPSLCLKDRQNYKRTQRARPGNEANFSYVTFRV